jgi:hypothetical protein
MDQAEQAMNNYNHSVAQSETAMSQDYYKNQPPFKGVPACIPFVPCADDMTPLVSAEDCRFQYIELKIDGKNYLAILTPWTVANGPGAKYDASERF